MDASEFEGGIFSDIGRSMDQRERSNDCSLVDEDMAIFGEEGSMRVDFSLRVDEDLEVGFLGVGLDGLRLEGYKSFEGREFLEVLDILLDRGGVMIDDLEEVMEVGSWMGSFFKFEF